MPNNAAPMTSGASIFDFVGTWNSVVQHGLGHPLRYPDADERDHHRPGQDECEIGAPRTRHVEKRLDAAGIHHAREASPNPNRMPAESPTATRATIISSHQDV